MAAFTFTSTKKTQPVSTFTFKNNTNDLVEEDQDQDVFEDAIGDTFTKYTIDTRISVDVMGTIFKVSRETLYKMSFFRNIIDSDEKVSNIYLDRSPITFDDILQYVTYDVIPGQRDGPNHGGKLHEKNVIMFINDSFFYGLSGVADRYVDTVFPPGRVQIERPSSDLVKGKLSLWKTASCDAPSNPIFCQRLSDKIGEIPNDAWKRMGESDKIRASDFFTYAIEHGSVCLNDILKIKGAQISHCACLNGNEFLVINGKTTCRACVNRMRNQ